jgi:hypothetical protein
MGVSTMQPRPASQSNPPATLLHNYNLLTLLSLLDDQMHEFFIH